MSHLFFWRQGQAGAVRYDGGKDGLKAKGEEGVEPEHEAVAALADVGRDLEAGHSDHHLVEGAKHDVACVAHGDGVGGGHKVQHHRVQDRDHTQTQLPDQGPVKLKYILKIKYICFFKYIKFLLKGNILKLKKISQKY